MNLIGPAEAPGYRKKRFWVAAWRKSSLPGGGGSITRQVMEERRSGFRMTA
jgi:hypothetical protein